jgi:TPR repeat protein
LKSNKKDLWGCAMPSLNDITRKEFNGLKDKSKKDIDAALTVAAVYMSGIPEVQKNTEKMFKYLKRAADLGDVGAALDVAAHYEGGHGGAVGRNDKKAFEYYMKAAKSGNTEGLLMVGDMYLHGRGVKPDAVKANQYIEAAAELDAIASLTQAPKPQVPHSPTLFGKKHDDAKSGHAETAPLLKKHSR